LFRRTLDCAAGRRQFRGHEICRVPAPFSP
jgi:hypothetical protein